MSFYLVFEILGVIAFLLIFGRAIYQKNRVGIFEIIAAAVFGIFLEVLNSNLSHSYFYSSEFTISIFGVPIAIGLGWAVIIYAAMLLSDLYNIPWKVKPIFDAFTALLLDLVMDIVAVRLGFWTWRIPLDQEWYGVPFDNLFGWVAVVVAFSFIVRFIRTLNSKRFSTRLLQVLTPVLAYILLTIQMLVYFFIVVLPFNLNNVTKWEYFKSLYTKGDMEIMYLPEVQMFKIIIFIIILVEMVNLIIWSIIKSKRKFQTHIDLLSFLILSCIHLFFFVAIFVSGMYKEIPVVIFISLQMLVLHFIMHLLPLIFQSEKHIYFLNKMKPVKNRLKKTKGHVESMIEDKFK